MKLDLVDNREALKESNRIRLEDKSFHDWYRFVLSFPPHLVQDYLKKFGATNNSVVLDPFCGTGTTIVECKKNGLTSYGIEANPFAAFASRVKINWDINPILLTRHAKSVAYATQKALDNSKGRKAALKSLPLDAQKLLLKNSLSPIPMHKAITLYEKICGSSEKSYIDIEKLAFANALVNGISNLRFGPEVGLGKIKNDAPVIDIWLEEIKKISDDLTIFREKESGKAVIFDGDARNFEKKLKKSSIDFVITSPPYPNEKDYTRITRLESVFLGYMSNRAELKKLKQGLLRSNTRNIYKGDSDDAIGSRYRSVEKIARQIEARRLELRKTSGFEKLYGKVTRAYFGGMARHFESLTPHLKKGARLAYVVGDQASYFRVMIRTGKILGEIAQSLGYQLESIDLFRTRFSTATGEQLREEIVVLRWPGL